MDRKGLEIPFGGIMAGFFLLIIMALLYFVFIGRYLDFHTIVAENEAEIHAINLANVLLSSNLTYSDEFTSYRGIFDKNNLDAVQNDKNWGDKKLDIWYPDTYAMIGIEDLDTNPKTTWNFLIMPKKIVKPASQDVWDCLGNTIKPDWGIFFRGLWEWPDMAKCYQAGANQITPSIRDYPVAIRISDNEIHTGRMKVSLAEII